MTVESQISHNCTDVMAPVTLSYLSAIFGAIYCPITTFGNGLVIVSILIDPFKELRTQFNFFVVNLAVADLIIGAIIDPFTSWAHFQEASRVEVRKEYPAFVKFCHYTYFASVTASLLSLSALSIDRVIAVRFPMRYRFQVSFVRYGVAALFIWILSFGLSALYFLIGYVFMAWIMASFSCVFTFIVMVCCYFLLYLVIKNREENMLKKLHDDEMQLEDKEKDQLDNGNNDNEKQGDLQETRATSQAHRVTQTKKVVVVLMVMFGFFLLCFVPATIMIFIINLEQGDCIFRHWLRDLQLLFCVTSSLINPFIYTIRLPNFRRAILAVLRIKNTRAVAPAGTQS